MNLKSLAFLLTSILLISCNNKQESHTSTDAIVSFQNEGHEFVYNMVQKVGNYQELANKKDVSYTYTYKTPDNKTDVSIEKYLFDGEYSYGHYTQHERTLSQLEGPIEQGYNGQEYWLKNNGEIISDSSLLKRVAFNRPTNYYWFCMMPKLLDPGLTYEYLGEKELSGKTYQIVKVSFEEPKDKPKDIYQLYINKETSLVDQFLFTVAEYGMMETPLLMKLAYQEVDGLLIPNKRKYKRSTWEAEESDKPWIYVTWSDIQFGTGITKEDFNK